jgi:2-polyprenyl-3-methyl-5-hydroxy-6-metoxy-1,4-benzoquinol methylase
MMSEKRKHWDAVYASKAADLVSWYRPHLDQSLRFIDAAALERTAAIIDVGGGASTLVDDLVGRGYSNVTVLDLSQTALDTSAARLGDKASAVTWICADINEADLPEGRYDFWHDRAVFHFLTDPAARTRYVNTARKALKPGGHIVVGTFGPQGPLKCSGLDVVRFTPEALHQEFGDDFARVADSTEIHRTPWGAAQEFVYCCCRLAK